MQRSDKEYVYIDGYMNCKGGYTDYLKKVNWTGYTLKEWSFDKGVLDPSTKC